MTPDHDHIPGFQLRLCDPLFIKKSSVGAPKVPKDEVAVFLIDKGMSERGRRVVQLDIRIRTSPNDYGRIYFKGGNFLVPGFNSEGRQI